MNYNQIVAEVVNHGGKMLTKRYGESIKFDDKEYMYSAAFDDEELADEFLETVNATKSGREIPDDVKCLTVYFSV